MAIVPSILTQCRTRAGLIAKGVVCRNRHVFDADSTNGTLEVGLVLSTSEVKALREGKCDITNSSIQLDQNMLVVTGMSIARWSGASALHDHLPSRSRPILVSEFEKKRLLKDLNHPNLTVSPSVVYFNSRGLAKMGIVVKERREQIDKREALKEKEYQRNLGV